MFLLNENEREYRFKDSGPKYLMKGPRSNFADFEAHYHNVMEENFYILEGEIDIVVDDVVNNLKAGDFIHIEPGEVHYCVNNYDVPIKMVSTLAPYQEVDKVVVEGHSLSIVNHQLLNTKNNIDPYFNLYRTKV